MKGLFIWWCLLVVLPVAAQQEQKVVSLEEAIRLAREQSLDAMVAKSQLRSAYWQYRNYRSDLLPNVTLTGTLPSFNRTLFEGRWDVQIYFQ